jgi:hypothetical protein
METTEVMIENPDYNPEFYQVPYWDHAFDTLTPNSVSAIEKRLALFKELQDNIWFGVMNWVLGQLVLKDPMDRRRHLWGHCFYFEAKKLRHPVYKYNQLW